MAGAQGRVSGHRAARLPVLLCSLLSACGQSGPARPERIVIDLAAGPVARFSPDQAFGAVIDGLGKGRVDQVYTPGNIRAIRSAGFGSTAYNLRTELGIEAWHWTDEGTWSDAAHAQGYWTGSDHPRRPVWKAWGYYLPRRGDTIDQANNDGYSRLDDGDRATFWKSNPYLDSLYARWPGGDQWMVADLGDSKPVSAVRIDWALPYASRYAVQYWVGDDETDPHGRWITFPHGQVTGASGAAVTIKLSDKPVEAQYLRVLLQQSAHVAPPHSHDRRDAMGYAVREIGFGTLDRQGHFRDLVVHGHSATHQTSITVSSTDPWHRASDRDFATEQPGFDRVVRSGLTNRLPILLNVGALYDTPENTEAEIRFFHARHYPIRAVEIGIEPDGQNVPAADFAALFMQEVDAIHSVDPHVPLAGPGLQDGVSSTWFVEGPTQSWGKLFIDALRKAGRLGDLDEFTFEHYPFDVLCDQPTSMLLGADAKLGEAMTRLTQDGVPPGMPRSILEYGFSAFSGKIEVEMPEALFDADLLARFLTLGGRTSYYLGYGPGELFDPENSCAGYGELMLFGQDGQGRASWPTPAFWSARLMTQAWSEPGNGQHLLYTAKWLAAGQTPALVVAYPVRRPDGRLAVLMINRDPGHGHVVDLRVKRRGKSGLSELRGPYEVFQYGAAQYRWQAAGASGHPTRNQPPRHFFSKGAVMLPPYSMTVVRSNDPG